MPIRARLPFQRPGIGRPFVTSNEIDVIASDGGAGIIALAALAFLRSACANLVFCRWRAAAGPPHMPPVDLRGPATAAVAMATSRMRETLYNADLRALVAPFTRKPYDECLHLNPLQLKASTAMRARPQELSMIRWG